MNLTVREQSGQVRVSFEDFLGNVCIMQTHLTQTYNEIRLRLGVINTHDNHESTPMYLSREDMILLLPYLEHFAKHGELPFEFLKD